MQHLQPRRVLALAVSLAILITVITAGTASAKFKLDYVALGDSYAAGPGIPNQIAVDTPPGCGQSDANYPHVIAGLASFINLTDVSCGGATTVHMTQPQTTAAGINPPQFNALSHKTDAVSVTIGGNDIGFGAIVATCISPVPTGQPCQDRYVTAAGDQLRARIDALRPVLDDVLDGIRDRSPHARVVVTGYPAILPASGPGCWPQMPYTPSDTAYLDGVERYLNDTIRRVARANRAGYGDSYDATLGHDACQPVDSRWVEPLVPGNPAAPVHPNAAGERAMARATLAGALWRGRAHTKYLPTIPVD